MENYDNYDFSKDSNTDFFLEMLHDAKNGNKDCQYVLGRDYYYARAGLKKDVGKAVYWLNKSAKQGNIMAVNFLQDIDRLERTYQQRVEQPVHSTRCRRCLQHIYINAVPTRCPNCNQYLTLDAGGWAQ